MTRGRYGPIWLSVTLPVKSMAIGSRLSSCRTAGAVPLSAITGLHALRSGMDVKAYAAGVGRARWARFLVDPVLGQGRRSFHRCPRNRCPRWEGAADFQGVVM